MKTFREEDLIAYHLGELSVWRKFQLRRRLVWDGELAETSEEVAATLRAFSGDAGTAVSEEMMDRNWQRVRRSLEALDVEPRSRGWMWAASGAGVLAMILVMAWVAMPRLSMRREPLQAANEMQSSTESVGQRLMSVLHTHTRAEPFNHRPGPLTTGPADAIAADPALAVHLDTAERVLTEVSHAEGALEPRTREQVHRLLLENAVYRQSAEEHGDMQAAAVIDDLGRVLTSLDAEAQEAQTRRDEEGKDAFRMQMNLGGVLLDLRILHRDDTVSRGQ